MFGRDADTRISDRKDRGVFLIFDRYGNAAMLTIILDGIVAEIIDDALQQLRYVGDHSGLSVKGHRNIFAFRCRRQCFYGFSRQDEQVHFFPFHVIRAFVQMRQPDNILDQINHALGLVVDPRIKGRQIRILYHAARQKFC